MSFQKVVNLWSQLPACTGKYHLMHAKEMRLSRSGKKKERSQGWESVCVCVCVFLCSPPQILLPSVRQLSCFYVERMSEENCPCMSTLL